LEELLTCGTAYLEINPEMHPLKTLLFFIISTFLKSLFSTNYLYANYFLFALKNVIYKMTRTIVTSALYCEGGRYSNN